MAYDLVRISNFKITRMMKQAVARLEGAKKHFTFRPRLAVLDDRLSKHTKRE